MERFRHRNPPAPPTVLPSVLILDVLREPPEGLSVTLPHDDGAHEELDGSDSLEGNLSLARSLVDAELVAKLILRDGVGVIDLVAEDNEGDLGQIIHGEKRVDLGAGFGEPLVVLGINEEDDAADLGEVISPQASGYF